MQTWLTTNNWKTKMSRMKEIVGKVKVGEHLNLMSEADKAMKVLTDTPSKYPTRSDAEDLKAMGYTENEMGFWFMIVQSHKDGTPAFKVMAGEERAANELLRKLLVQPFKGDLWICSTGCTWDVAKTRYFESFVFDSKAVVFSSPSQLMILSETP